MFNFKRTERPCKAMAVKTASTEADKQKDQLRRNVERMEAYQESRRDYTAGLEYTEERVFFMWHL